MLKENKLEFLDLQSAVKQGTRINKKIHVPHVRCKFVMRHILKDGYIR